MASAARLRKSKVMPIGAVQESFSPERLKEVFSRLSNEDNLTQEQFIALCQSLNLPLTRKDCERLFVQAMLKDSNVRLSSVNGALSSWRLLSAVVSTYSTSGRVTAANLDLSKPTAELYATDSTDMAPAFESARRKLDYSFHSNYTLERQAWQDELLESVVGASKAPVGRPWLVFTSGPPGSGKSYALSWLCEHGHFPLRDLVRIDIDLVKYAMPEWEAYVQHDRVKASWQTHKESGFIGEIAQHAAMERSRNVWVSSTLKDHKWFGEQFDRFRRTHPHYRIAIFYVTASEATVRRRAEARAKATGRDVPEQAIRIALDELPTALQKLTSKVDFVARIRNEDDDKAPELEAVQMVDNTGQWNVMRQHFSSSASPNMFPESLAPLNLFQTTLPTDQFEMTDLANYRCDLTEAAFDTDLLKRAREAAGTRALFVSPLSPVNLHDSARRLASIPDAATQFLFAHPLIRTAQQRQRFFRATSPDAVSQEPRLLLLLYGGFVYFDASREVVSVSAVTPHERKTMLQFGAPQTLPQAAVKQLHTNKRWQPVTLKFMLQAGATRFAWVLPGETLAGGLSFGAYGAFAYRFDGNKPSLIFPVASNWWTSGI